jgi:hypothetical protein
MPGEIIMTDKTTRKLPSLALVITLLTGTALLIFSGAESISGFIQNREDFSIGGLMEIITFAVPFFIISWFLWKKPKIGAIILMCTGATLGVWLYGFWGGQVELVVGILLVWLPLALGIFTLIREIQKDRFAAVSGGDR